MAPGIEVSRALRLAAAVVLAMPAGAATAQRPPIVGAAKFAAKTNDLGAERTFFGSVLGFGEAFASEKLVSFKVNDHQYIEISPDLQSETEDRVSFIAFETTDVRGLREFLLSRGVTAPEVRAGDDGNPSFIVQDPDGHAVGFVQYVPGSREGKKFGKALSNERVSQHIAHVGLSVRNRDAADRFYRDILGFRLMWQGGPTDDRIVYVCMRVPNGADWLEYMLGDQPRTPKALGGAHHLSLTVPSIEAGYRTVKERGYSPPREPTIGRNGMWQVNLYDHNLTRVELMEPKPVRTPCCSPMLGP
jgi:lactoylglutathione lyase